jgi:hypothetical protein
MQVSQSTRKKRQTLRDPIIAFKLLVSRRFFFTVAQREGVEARPNSHPQQLWLLQDIGLDTENDYISDSTRPDVIWPRRKFLKHSNSLHSKKRLKRMDGRKTQNITGGSKKQHQCGAS